MKRDEVPQDNSRTYGGHRKLLYARGTDGSYEGVQSSGWEPETAATLSAVEEFDALTARALRDWRAGSGTALNFWMHKRRMDLVTLSQVSGLFRWRIRRHLRPSVYERLPERMLQRYAEALGISVADLQMAPPENSPENPDE